MRRDGFVAVTNRLLERKAMTKLLVVLASPNRIKVNIKSIYQRSTASPNCKSCDTHRSRRPTRISPSLSRSRVVFALHRRTNLNSSVQNRMKIL